MSTPSSCSALALLAHLAATRRSLRIAYFGGSLSEGCGASDPATLSWRAQTTRFFRETFPAAEIHEINAAIGGTGSYLGAFRLEHDVLAAQPDLVFIEFAVNDNQVPEARVLRSLEGIVRHLRTAAPACKIVLVLNGTAEYFTDYTAGRTPAAVALHQRVAAHYGIHAINTGQKLWREFSDGHATSAELFTDGVHATDLGYAIYTEAVLAYLRTALAAPSDELAVTATSLPAPLTLNPLERATLVDAWILAGEGWQCCDQMLAGRYPHYVESTAPGATFTYAFTGTDVGLYWLVAPDSGEIEVSLDGQPPETFSSWDHYAKDFTRASFVTLAEDLPRAAHTITVRVLSSHPGESTGSTLRIGALLVQ